MWKSNCVCLWRDSNYFCHKCFMIERKIRISYITLLKIAKTSLRKNHYPCPQLSHSSHSAVSTLLVLQCLVVFLRWWGKNWLIWWVNTHFPNTSQSHCRLLHTSIHMCTHVHVSTHTLSAEFSVWLAFYKKWISD
jgi:hypothetical protein